MLKGILFRLTFICASSQQNICSLDNEGLLTFHKDVVEYKEINNILERIRNLKTIEKIREIDLSERKLIKIPTNIRKFKNLEVLRLNNNELTTLDYDIYKGISNYVFDELKALKRLYLDSNKLTKIEPNLFNGLSSLEILYLGNNQLARIDDDSFNGLSNLKELYLGNNRLKTIDGSPFNGLLNLRKLELHNNRLSEIGSEAFKGLSNLEELHIHYNKLKKITGDVFEGIPNLKNLYLNDNYLTEINGDVFRKIPNLLTLNLNDNCLTSIDSSFFEALKNLVWLRLQHNKLSALPDSIQNLNQPFIRIEIEKNSEFSLESGNGTLGIKDLRKISRLRIDCDSIQEKKLLSDVPTFVDKYLSREYIHWNLNKLKELRLPAAKDHSLSMDQMLEIIDKLLPVEHETDSFWNRSLLFLSKPLKDTQESTVLIKKTRNNIKDYIKRIHEKEVKTTRDYPMMKKEHFLMARRLLGNILTHFEKLADCEYEDEARAGLTALSDGVSEWSYKQITALNHAYALIPRKYKLVGDNIVSIIECKIAILKDSKFRSLISSNSNAHRVNIINYWVNKLKDTLGFTVNLYIEVEDLLNYDPFRGNSIAVLESFLDGVFKPNKIIDILAKEINDDIAVRNAFLIFILADESLAETEKEKIVSDASNPEGIEGKAVQYVLTKMNLLVANSKSVNP